MDLLRTRELHEALAHLNKHGGATYVVGGAVRDWILGLEPKDLDIEVYGLRPSALEGLLLQFGEVDLVGKSFGIYKVAIGGATYDFSLPRRDSKVGAGHRGFGVGVDPSMDPAEASKRRDFTINSMLYDTQALRLLDPHGGVDDLRRKLLRHTSEAFSEDPLRALRAAQFSARFGFGIAEETAELCRQMGRDGGMSELAGERTLEEMRKFLVAGKHHRKGFEVLDKSGWMDFFPEIKALKGVPQDPYWHPEGDVLEHTGLCLEALSRIDGFKRAGAGDKFVYALGVLCHDFGKPGTTRLESGEMGEGATVTSHGHNVAGLIPTRSFLQRLGIGGAVRRKVEIFVRHHMDHHWVRGAKGARKLAAKLSPWGRHPDSAVSIAELAIITEADHSGRFPLPAGQAKQMTTLLSDAEKAGCLYQPCRPVLSGEDITGSGVPAGKIVGVVLREAYERQLDGIFSDKAGALRWAMGNLFKLGTGKAGTACLIGGDDLKGIGIAEGPVFSHLLSEIYLLQLQGKITNKEQAVAFAARSAGVDGGAAAGGGGFNCSSAMPKNIGDGCCHRVTRSVGEVSI